MHEKEGKRSFPGNQVADELSSSKERSEIETRRTQRLGSSMKLNK